MADIESADTILKILGGGILAIGAWTMKLIHRNVTVQLAEHDERIRDIETSDHNGDADRKLAEHVISNNAQFDTLRKETNANITRLHDKLDTCVRDLTKSQNEQTNRIINMLTERK